jgi:hypothetical protein
MVVHQKAQFKTALNQSIDIQSDSDVMTAQMKTKMFLVLIILIVGCDATVSETAAKSTEEAPQMIDLHVQELGTKKTYIFTVTNTSGTQLTIQGYRSSCECVGLEIDKAIVSSGESLSLRCTIDSHEGFAGDYAFRVTLIDKSEGAKDLGFGLLVKFVDPSPSWSALLLVEPE